MSERLPYEEQLTKQWDDLTLPDEGMAWADMKRRLEEDKDDRVLIPPVRRGCGRGMLLIALLLLGGIILLRPDKWFTKDKKEDDERTEQVKVTKTDSEDSLIRKDIPVDREKIKDSIPAKEEVITSTSFDDESSVSKKEILSNNKKKEISEEGNSNIRVTASVPGKRDKKKPITANEDASVKTRVVQAKTTSEDEQKPNQVNVVTPSNNDPLKRQDSISADRNVMVTEGNVIKKDTQALVSLNEEKNNTIDSIRNDPVDSSSTVQKIKPAKEKRKIFFGAGLSLHQQIPIAGQQSTTYGSLGRKGLLSDYIPAPYIRMEKDRRWFIETGFRYGAPQHTKALTYKQNSVTDTTGGVLVINTSSSQLKKTFYHQLPLSFNFYLRDNWTIGTGIVMNRFHSAIVEKEQRFRIPGTQIDSSLGKTIEKISNDSALADGIKRSWTQAFFQMQYQWRRFTLGTRYSVGLQPYIQFTLPNSPTQSEKNSSFQLFLKYEIWRSKK